MTEFQNGFWLQLFADDETDEDTNPAKNEGEKDDNEEKETKTLTLTQEELDEMIKKAKARDRKSFRTQLEKEFKAEQEEAARVAKMSAEEKVQHDLEQYQARVAELEAEAERVKLAKHAAASLKEKDIEATDDLLSFLVGKDEEDTDEKVSAFIALFEGMIEKKEKEKAKGTTPKSTSLEHREISEIQKRINQYRK